MVKKGMITFGPLGNYRNAVLACGSCHNFYDRTSNTGWVFLPTRIDFFVQWEEKDFSSREQILEQSGRESERRYPNEQDYEDFMRTTGDISDPDDGICRGGLYHRYILEDMFAPIMTEALKEQGMIVPGIFPGGPKRWYGAPMAAINRGFVVMGAPEMKLPEKEWELLHKLQRLYSRKLQRTARTSEGSGDTIGVGAGSSFSQSERGSDTTPVRRRQGNEESANQPQHGNTRHASPQDKSVDSAVDVHSDKHTTGKRRRSGTADSDGSQPSQQSRHHSHWDRKRSRTVDLGVLEESWCFGPRLSTDDKVKFFTGKGPICDLPVTKLSQQHAEHCTTDDDLG